MHFNLPLVTICLASESHSLTLLHLLAGLPLVASAMARASAGSSSASTTLAVALAYFFFKTIYCVHSLRATRSVGGFRGPWPACELSGSTLVPYPAGWRLRLPGRYKRNGGGADHLPLPSGDGGLASLASVGIAGREMTGAGSCSDAAVREAAFTCALVGGPGS